MKSNTHKIKVCIVEDDIEIAKSWQEILDKEEKTTCIGVYSSAEEAEKKITKNLPDVILMDIGLPGKDGIELTKELKYIYPKLEILICTVFQERDKIVAALKAGASGYILKNISAHELIHALTIIMEGGSPIDTHIARKIIVEFQPTSKKKLLEPLTKREEDVLNYIAKGYRNQEIADILSVSINTIRSHIRNIYDKLQVNSRIQAVKKYFG